MTDDTMKKKVLARVRKLMSLANNAGATEGERDNALRMAHATLAKYNLSLEQAEGAENDERRGRLKKEFLGKPWCIQIAGAIAKLYFCEYYYQTVGGNAGPTQTAIHVFIGLESNTTTAAELAEWIVTTVNREAQRHQRAIGGRYPDYRAFAQGAALRIWMRCDEMREKTEKEGLAEVADDLQPNTPGTALVIAGLYDREKGKNLAVMETLGIRLGKGRSSSYDSSKISSRMAGARYGSTVSLSRQLK